MGNRSFRPPNSRRSLRPRAVRSSQAPEPDASASERTSISPERLLERDQSDEDPELDAQPQATLAPRPADAESASRASQPARESHAFYRDDRDDESSAPQRPAQAPAQDQRASYRAFFASGAPAADVRDPLPSSARAQSEPASHALPQAEADEAEPTPDYDREMAAVRRSSRPSASHASSTSSTSSAAAGHGPSSQRAEVSRRDSTRPVSAAPRASDYDPPAVGPDAQHAAPPATTERPSGYRPDHDDPLLMHFFSSSPPPVSDDGAEHYHVPMSAGSRRAMWASMGIFVVSVLSIGSYTAYHQLLMPTPVELGGPVSPELIVAQPSAAVPTALPELNVTAFAPTARASAATPAASASLEAERPAQGDPARDAVDVVPATVPSSPAPDETVAALATDTTSPAEPAVPDSVPTPEPANEAAPAAHAANGATSPSYEELIGVGQAFARKGRNREALEAYQRALDAQPTAAAALAGIAYVHLNAGDKGLAKLFASRAVESDPSNSQGWIVLGAAQELFGERQAAREAYRRCATEAVGSYVLECRRLAR